MSARQYQRAVEAIQRYILAGDCYQVNLAQRFSSRFDGDPWDAYRMLRPLAAAHFAGYMECSNKTRLLCLSPERFLKLAGQRVEARPIKGTRPRHEDALADKASADELRQSAKDRAENLMIVDLLRNDMGRNCKPGSIQVDRLFELESYPTVHHLVSTISGELRDGRNAGDLLRDCFPGGSITGAPKRRAMEIIEELEPDPRQAYCGSMLYISADGRMDSNIAIRSLLCEEDRISCWGGGGIVADSEWESEYQETWDKVGRFIKALETGIS
jgi:para-aminobenzoate synthetase component 1